MKVEINTDDAWKILRKHRVKILASSQESIEEIDRILKITEDVVKDVVKSMRYLKTKQANRYIIEWEKGYLLHRCNIKRAFIDEKYERLYIVQDGWIIVFGL